MAGDYVLAIDQGTTSSRAIVFNHDSATVGEAQREFTQHYPRPGWVEHDADEIWDVTLGVMREALEDAGVSPEVISAPLLRRQFQGRSRASVEIGCERFGTSVC